MTARSPSRETSAVAPATSRRFRQRGLLAALAAFGLLLAPGRGRAEEAVLTRARVAELVGQAPAARVLRTEAAVTGAAATASQALSLENPVLSGLGGVRFNADGTRPFSGVASLSWPVDLGGKRGARREAALAERRAALATATGEGQKLLLGALLQHASVLRDERALSVAISRHALSERVHAAAERRYAAGSVPELDVALAGLQEKRDASAEASAMGGRDAGKVLLLTLLGATGEPAVSGSLVPEGDVPALSALVQRVDERPELRAASAAVGAARAKAERERASRTPTVNLLAQYERDDGDNIGLLGLALPIPILNTNQVEVATSAAEVDAARARAAYSRSSATGQLKELHARYQATKAALESLAPTAALAIRAVTLATRGYELGENDLASVLLVRREAVEAEAAMLEVEHAHAATKLELLLAAGKMPR